MSCLVDVNILLYATNADAPRHKAPWEWLDHRLSDEPGSVGLPWFVLIGFMRIATHSQMYTSLSSADAWGQVEDWLSRPAACTPSPTRKHTKVLGRLITESGASGNLLSDAHLAALAAEHAMTVASADQDFARFADAGLVEWIEPTQPTHNAS